MIDIKSKLKNEGLDLDTYKPIAKKDLKRDDKLWKCACNQTFKNELDADKHMKDCLRFTAVTIMAAQKTIAGINDPDLRARWSVLYSLISKHVPYDEARWLAESALIKGDSFELVLPKDFELYKKQQANTNQRANELIKNLD